MNHELLEKLQRQRRRMGETCSPLRVESQGHVSSSRASVALDYEVHVKQRVLGFQQEGLWTNCSERQQDGVRGESEFANSSFALGFWKERERAPCTLPWKSAARREPQILDEQGGHEAVGDGVLCPDGLQDTREVCTSAADDEPEQVKTSVDDLVRHLPTPLRSRGGARVSTPPPSMPTPEEAADKVADMPSLATIDEHDHQESEDALTENEHWNDLDEGGAVRNLFGHPEPVGETLVLRPLQDWLKVPVRKLESQAEATKFVLEDGDGDDCTQRHAAEENLEMSDRGDSEDAGAAGFFEYDLLDYLDMLPEGLMSKLKGSFQMYEEFVQDMCKRNEHLQNKLAKARATSPTSSAAPSSSTTSKAKHRNEFRRDMSNRILLAQVTRLRIAAEANEAASRAKLQYTKRVAHERMMALTKAVEAQEESFKERHNSARIERRRVRRELETVRMEIDQTAQQVLAIEQETLALDARSRHDPERSAALQKEAADLRNELKAQEAMISKFTAKQRMVKDLTRELKDAKAAVARLTPAS